MSKTVTDCGGLKPPKLLPPKTEKSGKAVKKPAKGSK